MHPACQPKLDDSGMEYGRHCAPTSKSSWLSRQLATAVMCVLSGAGGLCVRQHVLQLADVRDGKCSRHPDLRLCRCVCRQTHACWQADARAALSCMLHRHQLLLSAWLPSPQHSAVDGGSSPFSLPGVAVCSRTASGARTAPTCGGSQSRCAGRRRWCRALAAAAGTWCACSAARNSCCLLSTQHA